MWRADLQRFGQRDGEAKRVGRVGEPRCAIERRSQSAGVADEFPACGTWSHRHHRAQVRALGNANLVRAGEVVRNPAQLERFVDRGVLRNAERRDHRIVAFEHMVHEPADQQRLWRGIAERAHADALGQFPLDLHAEPRVARVRPVTVPFVRAGREEDRNARLATGSYRAFHL